MGWLWASPKDPSAFPPPSQYTTSAESSDPPLPTPQSQTLSDTTTTSPHALLSSQEPQPTPHQPKPNPNPSNPPSPPSPITPTTTLPSTLSCRSAFDAAFHCQSFGGQFANVYRYGSLRSCSSQWGDFWFCMSTNRGGMMDAGRREESVRAWALNREREKYGFGGKDGEEGSGGGGGLEKGSSEDVWEARRWKVRGAFGGDWGDLEREARERAEGGMQVQVQDEVR